MEDNLDILISSRKLANARAMISEKLSRLICEVNGVTVTGSEAASYDQTMDSASIIMAKKTLELQKFLDRTSKRELKVIQAHLEKIAIANRQFNSIMEVCNKRINFDYDKYANMESPYKKYEFYDIYFLSAVVDNIDKAIEIINDSLSDVTKTLELFGQGRLETREAIEFLSSRNMKSESGRVVSELGAVDNIIGLDNMKSEMKSFTRNKVVVKNPKFEDYLNYLNTLDEFTKVKFSKTIDTSIAVNVSIDKTISKIYKYRKSDFKHSRGTTNQAIDNRYDIVDVYNSIQIRLMSAIRAYIDLVLLLTANIGIVYKDSKNILTTKAFVMARG